MTTSGVYTVMGISFNIYAIILLVFFVLFALMLRGASRRGELVWTDLITRDGTKVSTTKILQIVGGVVGTWIIIQVTLQNKLTWDLFAIYLAYVASVDAFSKLLLAKYGGERDNNRSPYRRERGISHQEEDYEPGVRSRRTNNSSAAANGGARTPDID